MNFAPIQDYQCSETSQNETMAALYVENRGFLALQSQFFTIFALLSLKDN